MIVSNVFPLTYSYHHTEIKSILEAECKFVYSVNQGQNKIFLHYPSILASKEQIVNYS